MKSALKVLWKDEQGQDLVEYGLLLVLIALGAVVGMGSLANAINAMFSNAASSLNTPTQGT